MSYINEQKLPTIGKNEIVPWTITFEEIQTIDAITRVYRYTESSGDTTGVDISANASAATNVLTLTDIWIGSDTRAAGTYRIEIRVTDSTGTTQRVEANFIVKVL